MRLDAQRGLVSLQSPFGLRHLSISTVHFDYLYALELIKRGVSFRTKKYDVRLDLGHDQRLHHQRCGWIGLGAGSVGPLPGLVVVWSCDRHGSVDNTFLLELSPA
jgi:hypothetical protein